MTTAGRPAVVRMTGGRRVRVPPGKPAPEKQKHFGKTNLDLLKQEIVTGSGISYVAYLLFGLR